MESSINTAVVLAGGLGSRLKELVNDRPKPMADINGKPFLEYLLNYWEKQGINKFILSVGYLHHKIVDYFGSRFRSAVIEYVVENNQLGTGGALLNCYKEKSLSEPFLLLNGDTYFPINLNSLNDMFLRKQADWCFSLFKTFEINRYLLIDIDHDCRINLENSKKQLKTKEYWANGGVYIVNPAVLSKFKYLKSKVSLEDYIISKSFRFGDKFFGFKSDNSFIDIGLPRDYKRILNKKFIL